ncbi:hypothetical protein AGMMS50230_18560 [Spirochaetia bacterium]|nr:hypothetical protein AGMMS50230_18560 [Spirochaetia bacterium]
MSFVKNDPRINRKGRPHKVKVFSTNHEEAEHEEDEFFLWSRKNKFTGARYCIARRWPPKYAAVEKLIEHGIIIEHDDESLEWTLNRESLVDLFYNQPFPNMKWEPVETAFNLKRYSLRFYVSKNGGSRYYQDGETNPDYEKVKRILEKS